MKAQLYDWYKAFGDDECVFTKVGMRGRFKGVWFQVDRLKEATAFIGLGGRQLVVDGQVVVFPDVLVIGRQGSMGLRIEGRE